MLTCTNTQAEEIVRLRMEGGGHSTATNATEALPHLSWQDWDAELNQLITAKLGVFGDLSNRVSRALRVSQRHYVYQTATGDFKGKVTMDFEKTGTRNRVHLTDYTIPVPIYSQEFGYKAREIEAVMEGGGQYDAAGRDASVYAVMDLLEDMALNGTDVAESDTQAYGLLNFNHRVESSVTGKGTLASADSFAPWQGVVEAIVKGLAGKNLPDEPFVIYVNASDWAKAKVTRYNTYDSVMVADAVLRLSGVIDVVTSSKIASGKAIGVTPRRDVVQIPYALPIAIRQEERVGIRAPYEFVTEAISSIALKADAKGNTGVVEVTVSA